MRSVEKQTGWAKVAGYHSHSLKYKFTKRPVEIEAFQMTEARRQDNSEWPEWLHRAWNYGSGDIGAVYCRDWPNSDGKDPLVINTLEGRMAVSWNDWIIKGVRGELYPCKPDIFEATYDAVSEDRLSWSAQCDTLLTKLQSVINSGQKRTYEEMKSLADRLTEMGVAVAGMELQEYEP